MPSKRRASDALLAIEQNVLLGQSFVANMSFDEFVADVRTLYATTRCLEIISEASRRLPDELKDRHQHVNWRQIASAGNVYRHDYENIVNQLLWHTIRESLGVLLVAVRTELGGTD